MEYPCLYCEKSYSSQGNLNKHQKTSEVCQKIKVLTEEIKSLKKQSQKTLTKTVPLNFCHNTVGNDIATLVKNKLVLITGGKQSGKSCLARIIALKLLHLDFHMYGHYLGSFENKIDGCVHLEHYKYLLKNTTNSNVLIIDGDLTDEYKMLIANSKKTNTTVLLVGNCDNFVYDYVITTNYPRSINVKETTLGIPFDYNYSQTVLDVKGELLKIVLYFNDGETHKPFLEISNGGLQRLRIIPKAGTVPGEFEYTFSPTYNLDDTTKLNIILSEGILSSKEPDLCVYTLVVQ